MVLALETASIVNVETKANLTTAFLLNSTFMAKSIIVSEKAAILFALLQNLNKAQDELNNLSQVDGGNLFEASHYLRSHLCAEITSEFCNQESDFCDKQENE